jgi:hypothetical protein
MGTQNPQTISLNLLKDPISKVLSSDQVAINPDNSWRIATAFRLHRVDTLTQLTHNPASGQYASWKWASTKHENVKRVAWRGGEPPFRLTIIRSGLKIDEITFDRVQSSIDPTKYNHNYPSAGYDHVFTPTPAENGSVIKFKYFIESQDGQTLLIDSPVTVDDSRFKYFDSANGNNANAGTFDAPYQTFGYGYASVANANTFIYCYKNGTYLINNGTAGNSASFDATHCKSHVGIGSGVVFDCSGGSFTGGGDDIYISNVTVTGGDPAMQGGNVRQFNFGGQCNRVHFHRVTGDTTVIGNTGNDNPACIFFPDFSGEYHDDIAFTDCKLSATSKTQFAVLFQVRNFLFENFVSLSPTLPVSNGYVTFGLKDACLNGTIRHSDIIASTPNLLTQFYSQDWVNCGNLDIQYCRLINLNPASTVTISFNDQVDNAPKAKPENYWVQRCSIDALNGYPFSFKNYTGLGHPVNYSGVLWESTASTIDGGTTGGVTIGVISAKVSDINNVSSADLGVRGHIISSTLVS